MRAEHYIEELLYRYHCVVMPGFGAFLAHSRSAEIHSGTNTITPPTKVISFNGQLAKNDGLLVSHMAKALKLPYEEMLLEVEAISKEWHERLTQGEELDLIGIGTLSNSAGRIQFQPENKTNFLISSFGLSPFTAIPVQREILKEEVEELEERVPFLITPEKHKQRRLAPWLKYAAVILLAVSAGFTGYRFYHENTVNQEIARQEAQKEVSRLIQEATFFESAPIELPALNISVKKANKGSHHVIAGAFRIENNADKKVKQLRAEGHNALYLGQNKYGLHQVAYASFEDPKEALAYLKKIRRTESPDAWLLSEK
ncbi:SPOR domain-containing protein [Allomuricauda sp. SCSIO 65647]|uniref:HU domain-containing protein n=1 Tax=Allomuricauda sp. SCSIO 65647 TaxID=2908843 RepID=UPI001F298907|nr:SPOR domain-containing protein [Muricauda sp. SCSIO 65647]UJH68999.1 SPOR domain-containing protein [Muricauda sp. SCSIO 65647]